MWTVWTYFHHCSALDACHLPVPVPVREKVTPIFLFYATHGETFREKFQHCLHASSEQLTNLVDNVVKINKKTMWSVTQKSLLNNMFNIFLHPHVHRWPSNEEKICLWICLTPVECNCILIWAQGKTSVHSAAGNPTSHSIVFIQLSLLHTTNLYRG